jgi:hypothetical protein
MSLSMFDVLNAIARTEQEFAWSCLAFGKTPVAQSHACLLYVSHPTAAPISARYNDFRVMYRTRIEQAVIK